MIRTTLSYCALFASLILVSKWLHDSSHARTKPAAAPVHTEVQAEPVQIEEAAAPQELTTAQTTVQVGHQEAPIQLTAFEDRSLEDVLNSLRSETPVVARQDAAVIEAAEKAIDVAITTTTEAKTDKAEEAAKVEEAAKTESTAAEATTKNEAEIPLTDELIELRGRLREALAYYYFRPENVALRSPWGAMHAMIAYGVDSELIAGTKRVNAIGYLCYNGTCNGQQLFYLAENKLQTRIGPGVQGHPGQFLAMLAQSKVKTDFPLLVEGKNLTVADLIKHEKETCRPRTELTFKLIAFTHYLKSDEKWVSYDGQDWDIPRVIKEELAQPIVGAACGGTHRMTGFSYALRKREGRGEKFEGQWLRAKKFVEDYHEYAFRLQNPDGSFSTDFFAGRADFGPISKRLETTGHITEWLTFSLKKDQLVEPRMLKSVSYLTNLLLDNRNEKWGIGPLGHGLHALAMYDERIFGGKPGTRAVEFAEVKKEQDLAKAKKEKKTVER